MPGDGEVGPHEKKRAISGSEGGFPSAGPERDPLTALALALAAVAVISAVTYIAEHTGEADRSAASVPTSAWQELFR
jgi:hypothetical protein